MYRRMDHLPAAKHKGKFYFIALFYEAPRMFNLMVKVMRVYIGSELNFFNMYNFLFLFCFLSFFYLFKLKLAIINNSNYRRILIWSYLYEIKFPLSGNLQCIRCIYYLRLSLFAYKSYFFSSYSVIYRIIIKFITT